MDAVRPALSVACIVCECVAAWVCLDGTVAVAALTDGWGVHVEDGRLTGTEALAHIDLVLCPLADGAFVHVDKLMPRHVPSQVHRGRTVRLKCHNLNSRQNPPTLALGDWERTVGVGQVV